MKTISETAHAHNIDSMEQLSSFLSSYTVTFRSKSTTIDNKKLQQLYKESKKVSQEMKILTNNYCQTLRDRETAFSLISNIGNALLNSRSGKIYHLAKKLNHFDPLSAEELDRLTLEVKERGKHLREIDRLDVKYEKCITAFSLLISFIEDKPTFHPTEEIPSIESLKEILVKITASYNGLKSVRSTIVKTRIARFDLMYKKDLGLIDIAHDTKVFVKKNFGPNSKEWKKITSIEFKRLK